jgi:hypothetical protein
MKYIAYMVIAVAALLSVSYFKEAIVDSTVGVEAIKQGCTQAVVSGNVIWDCRKGIIGKP